MAYMCIYFQCKTAFLLPRTEDLTKSLEYVEIRKVYVRKAKLPLMLLSVVSAGQTPTVGHLNMGKIMLKKHCYLKM